MINIWSNFLSDLATASASSAASGFPATNVQNAQPTAVWVTGVSTATEWILFDLGSAKAITDFICAFHNLTASDSSLTLQYGDDGTTGAGGLVTPVGTVSITRVAGPIQKSFTTKTYRYFCFVFTKSSSSETRQIGRIYLGGIQTINPPDMNGLSVVRQDLSLVNTSRGGQDFGLLKPSKRLCALTYTNAHDSDKSTLDGIYQTGGKVLKFFMQIDSNSGDADISAILYVRFNEDPSNVQTDGLDSDQRWDLGYSFLEQI